MSGVEGAYRSLLSAIGEIQKETVVSSRQEYNAAIIASRWRIGNRIQETLQKGGKRAGYDSQLLARLAKDLSVRYGPGFSRRNLNDMRRLYQKFRQKDLHPELSWSQVRVLLDVADDRVREKLQKQAIAKKWTHWTLMQHVRAANREGGDISALAGKLVRPTGQIYSYVVRRVPKRGLYVDVGFSIWIKPAVLHVKGVRPDEIVRAERAGRRWNLRKMADDVRALYLFAAELDHVVDGDTLAVYVDCGMGIRTKRKLRLRYVDAPEMDTVAGKKAKRYVEGQLKGCKRLLVKTHKVDKYDRYLADVLYLNGAGNPEKILQDGVHLNRELLEKGIANYMGDRGD